MAKSVYSIVLDDAVVAALDQWAGRQGCSRSAAINRLLAHQLGLDTPQQQMQQILAAIQQETALQLLSASDAQMQLRSALRYKYNPTVRYQIELGTVAGCLGVLRVSLRTRNAALLTGLDSFYQLWGALEQRNLPHPETLRYNVQDGRFARVLRSAPPGCDADRLGQLLAGYVELFDRCLNLFFQFWEDTGTALGVVEHTYREGLTADIAKL